MPTTSSTYRFKDKRCSCHATTQRYITVVNGLTRGVNAGYASHKPPCFSRGSLTFKLQYAPIKKFFCSNFFKELKTSHPLFRFSTGLPFFSACLLLRSIFSVVPICCEPDDTSAWPKPIFDNTSCAAECCAVIEFHKWFSLKV